MQQKKNYLRNSNQLRYVSVTSDVIFLLFYGSFTITYNFFKLFIKYLYWNTTSCYTQIKFDVSGKELVIPLSSNPQPEHDDDDDGYTREIVQRILAAKDDGLVSDKAYHEIRIALPEHVRAQVPPLSSLLEERKKQNGEINISTIPEVNTLARP